MESHENTPHEENTRDPSSLDRFERLFRAAQLHPPEERAAFLEAACADDATLRRELESLLAADEAAEDGAFLDVPAADWAAEVVDIATSDPMEGRTVGPYTVVRPLGHGGMGDVYLALRTEPFKRYVALKVIRRGMNTRDVLRRFAVERQILASLDHPNIAKLLDGGATDDGLPYLVMEYVEGRTLTAYCDERRLGVAERLRLFQQVCRVVHAAHRNLVLHRDLKPSNILVTADGTVKLLDFGIAKLLNPSLSPVTVPMTRAEQRLMTPEYASPEQVRGETLTTASDVYALGVVLYELLTGRLPYRLTTRSTDAISEAVCEQEPEPPSTRVGRTESGSGDADEAPDTAATITPEAVSTARGTSIDQLRRRLRGDLDTIVLAALRKEPERRYGSAEQLAADIGRYLEGLPVEAAPDSRTYRLRKFVRRHWIESVAAVLVLVSLITGLGVALWQAERARTERDRAEAALVEAEQTRLQSDQVADFLISLFRASDPSEARGETVTAEDLLREGVARADELADQPLVHARMLDMIGNVYLAQAKYAEAQPLLERALAIRRQHLGEHHFDVAESLLGLGLLMHNQGSYDAAENYYRQSLAVWRALYGDTHESVVRGLYHLAVLHAHQGEYDTAEQLLREGAEQKRVLGPSATMGLLLTDLGAVLRVKGDVEAAEHVLREALDVQRAALDPDHPDMIRTLTQLARVHRLRGELEDAETVFREAIALQRKIYGDAHPSLALSLQGLALVLQDKGDLAAAESSFRESLAMQRRVLGAEHPEMARGAAFLASLLQRRGNYAEAEALVREALAVFAQHYGEESEETTKAREQLAQLMAAQDRPE